MLINIDFVSNVIIQYNRCYKITNALKIIVFFIVAGAADVAKVVIVYTIFDVEINW